LRDERRLRVFENRVLRRIFGSMRDEVTGDLRTLRIVRVIKSRRMRWTAHVAHMGERRGVYRVLMGKPEGKKPLGRPWCRWEYNIKLDHQEVGCGGMGWSMWLRIGTGDGHL